MARFLIALFLGFIYPSLSFATVENTVKKFPAPKDGKLTIEMENFYQENGFLILENFASSEKVAALKARAKYLARKYHIDNKDKLKLFYAEDSMQDRSQYLIDSADKIKPFYEAGAIDEGVVLYFPEDSMSKLGYAVHSNDKIFKEFSTAKQFVALTKSLNIKSPVIIQSKVLFKPAKIGSAVNPHQDAAFLMTNPQSVTGFWTALDPATKLNGCLQVIPGGHETKELYAKFVFIKDESGQGSAKFIDEVDMGWKDEDFVPLEVEPGTLVILHGMLPYKSGRNASEAPQNAYSFHVISGEAEYSDKNWMQTPNKVALSQLISAAAKS